jgi:hypothetical protein
MIRLANGSSAPIEDIRKGDVIFGMSPSGEIFPTEVINIYENGIKDVNRYFFKHRGTITTLSCTPDHKVVQCTEHYLRDGKRLFLSPLPELLLGRYRRYFPRYVGVQANYGKTFGLAFILGLLLGDGWCSSKQGIFLSCADGRLVEDLEPYLFDIGLFIHKVSADNWSWRISSHSKESGSNIVKNYLRENGLLDINAYEKSVPNEVWSWDKKSVAYLLGGLFSADGSFFIANDGIGRISFASTSFTLARQVKDLLSHFFGIYGSTLLKSNSGGGQRTIYTITFGNAEAILKFKKYIPVMGVKADELKNLPLGKRAGSQASLLTLAGIIPDGQKYTFDLEVDCPTHVFALENGLLVSNSSKTFSMTVDLAAQFTGRVPKSLEGIIPSWRLDKTRRIRYCMADYPNNFLKVVWPYVTQLISESEIVDVVKEQGRIKAITNDAGGFIEFMFYESDITKFYGASRHVCAYDEEAPEEIRKENLARLIDTDGEEIFAATPLEGAVTYLYNILEGAGKVVEKLDGQIIERTNPEGDSNVHVFFFNIYDNRGISKSSADRILAMFPEEERIVRQTGHFLFRAGLVHHQFSDNIHLIPPLNDWYKPATQADYTLYVAIDPHPRIPHAVMFMVVRRDGFKAVVDELFIKTKTAKELVDAIKAKAMGKPINVIIIDPLAFTNDPSTGSCFAFDLVDAGLYPVPIPGSKDLARGIILTNEWLTPDENGKPGIYITRNCERTRYEIVRYAWGEWSRNTKLQKAEKQKPMDKDDHMMENLHRLVLLNPSFVPEPEEIEETVPYQPRLKGKNEITGY